MFRTLTLLFLLFFLPCLTFAQQTGNVAKVINGKSFQLATGEQVRLAGIEVPNISDIDPNFIFTAPEPKGEEALRALRGVLDGHEVRIVESKKNRRDRYNRLLGQVYTDNIWVQGEMLNQGYAFVYNFADSSPDMLTHMLALENAARTAGRGIWTEPYFRVITPAETSQYINRFKIVAAKVTSVNVWHDHIYVNFTERWKGNFNLFISSKDVSKFSALYPLNWPGKTLRARGWIHLHNNAPSMDISMPGQIEVE